LIKFDKNFLIPLLLGITVSTLSVIYTKMPLSIVLGILIFILIPILLIQNKTNNDWGMMFILGIPTALIFIILLVVILIFSNNYPWINDVLFWPYK